MSKDGKLGLVIGIAVVIVIAVVFFRKDGTIAKASAEQTASVKPKSALQPSSNPRLHTVAAGDTLFSLADRYYNDRSKFVVLYQANQEQLATPDRLPPGTVLVVPEIGGR